MLRAAAAQGLRGPTPNGEWQVCCPFCPVAEGKEDRKFKMYMNPEKGFFHCFRCGTSGRAGLGWLEPGKPVVEVPKEAVDLGPPENFVELNGYNLDSITARPYIDYLRHRSLLAQALQCGVGFCPIGRYGGRLIVPVWDFKREWKGFVARTIYGQEPKYLYPYGMDRAGQVYGLHLPMTHEVWVVEGVMDAIALQPAAVATFGKNVSDTQVDIIENLASNGADVVICLDGDAWEEARTLAVRLALRDVPCAWCRLPPGEDPGSLLWGVRNFIERP